MYLLYSNDAHIHVVKYTMFQFCHGLYILVQK
jgi:hypothetical protein